MVEARFRWRFPTVAALPAGLAIAAEQAGVSPRLAGLLADRGVQTADDLAAWFGDPLDGLHDPARLPDAGRLLERLRRARAAAERVQVFGDFDADGLTGLAILTLALRRFGVEPVPYVPSRLDEGHGLSYAALERREREPASP